MRQRDAKVPRPAPGICRVIALGARTIPIYVLLSIVRHLQHTSDFIAWVLKSRLRAACRQCVLKKKVCEERSLSAQTKARPVPLMLPRLPQSLQKIQPLTNMCLDNGPTGQPRVRAFEGSPVQGAVTHHAGFWWAVEI